MWQRNVSGYRTAGGCAQKRATDYVLWPLPCQPAKSSSERVFQRKGSEFVGMVTANYRSDDLPRARSSLEGRTIAGANEIRFDTSLSNLSLASAPQIALAKPRVSFSDIVYDCVVGVDFWRDGTLTVDLTHRQLIVSNPSRSV